MATPPIELQRHLDGVEYPADKQELLARLRDRGAPAELIDALEDVPDQTFDGPIDVSRAFGGGS